MDDKNGKWVTINGTHIFIKDGQTVEEAFAERDTVHKSNIDTIVNKVRYADAQNLYYDKDNNRLMPKKYFKQVFKRCLETYPIFRSDMEDVIVGCLNKKIDFLQLQDHGVSDYDSSWERLRLNLNKHSAKITEIFCHEMGHAMDNISWNKYRSSTFVSKKYGKTMVDMLFDELKQDGNLDLLNDEYVRLEELSKQIGQAYNNGDIDRQEFNLRYIAYQEAGTSIVDMVQAVWGKEECKKRFGFLAHPKPPTYFEGPDGRISAGTELFAELTANKATDKDKEFYDVMKYYAPKAIEIYEEIMEEVKNEYRQNP